VTSFIEHPKIVFLLLGRRHQFAIDSHDSLGESSSEARSDCCPLVADPKTVLTLLVSLTILHLKILLLFVAQLNFSGPKFFFFENFGKFLDYHLAANFKKYLRYRQVKDENWHG